MQGKGQDYQYHLDFATLEVPFENYRGLFEEMSTLFTYLIGEG